jgi:hypothetical protein
VPRRYDPPVRPPGVWQRVRELGVTERRLVDSWGDRALRVQLTVFVDLCARLWFGDHGTDVVLRRFDAVAALLDDPGQRRTGTDFEARCLTTINELRPMIAGLSSRSLDEQDSVRDVLVSVPAWTILGECERESHFDLVCWNEANALAEQVQRPYLAARHIAAEDFHQPLDRFGLIAPMTELAERYEDHPDGRATIAAEIGAELAAFRARAPWPITDGG